jgi:uncharacterized protein (DUF58 family)
MAAGKIRVERVRFTTTGVWYIVVTLIVGAAAANTGNNALYLVEAVMLGLLVASGLLSRRNLRGLELSFGTVPEVHAGQALRVPLTIGNRDRWLGRRFLEISGVEEVEPLLIRHVERRSKVEESLSLRFDRRGFHRIPYLRVASLFPLGFFDKAMRYRAGIEVLVFPRLHPVSASRYFDRGRVGDELTKKRGWSHELRSLRDFRSGDDPRSIHWKRSARTGDLVFMEREAEAGRRLALFFDNAWGDLDESLDAAFEETVSEVASLAVHYLDQGFEVALTTRDEHIHYGRGRAHEVRLLRSLALVTSIPKQKFRLWKGRARSTEVRFGPTETRRVV